MSRLKLGVAAAIAMFAVTGAAGQACAAGFQIFENGTRGLGRAFAGAGAAADDASTVFFNPAGMTHLDRSELTAALHGIFPTASFENANSRIFTGAPLSGAPNTSSNGTAVIPNMFGVWSYSENLKFGFGLNAPYGLRTDYLDNWPGRYQAIHSELETIDFNPAVAWRPLSWLSLGGGISMQYAGARLTSAIDFGSICVLSQLAGALPAGTCTALGLSPQQNDGNVDIHGDDVAAGWNAGILVDLDLSTRVGIHYRSKVVHTLDGQAEFSVPTAALALTSTGQFRNTDATAKLTVPETVSTSVYHAFGGGVAAMADVTWTRWTRFRALTVDFVNPVQADQTTAENWRNTWRGSAGLEYTPTENWALRTGLAWDETPVRTSNRTPRVPDANRWWLTFGGSYRWSDDMSLDLGFAHIQMSDARVNQASLTSGTLTGAYSATTVDIVSFQTVFRF